MARFITLHKEFTKDEVFVNVEQITKVCYNGEKRKICTVHMVNTYVDVEESPQEVMALINNRINRSL